MSKKNENQKREWRTFSNKAADKYQLSLKVMHWNILAAKLCDKDKKLMCKEKYLDWDYRCKLILKHIKKTDPDVLGISELDCAKFKSVEGKLKKNNKMAA